jgi:hypothetical protein
MSTRVKYEEYKRRVLKRHSYAAGASYMRDSEMSKTYKAEWALFKEVSFDRLDNTEAERFVKQVLKSKFWKENSCRDDVEIRWMKDMGDRAATSGVSYGRIVYLAPNTTKYIILHELVHSMGFMNHGLFFRTHLVKACSRFLGRGIAKSLKNKFREQGLRMNKPRAPLTYDKWLEKYENYAVNR